MRNSVTVISPGPGSAVGEKGNKTGSNRKNIGEGSEPRGDLGGGKAGATFSSPQTASRLASLADFFLLFPHCGAWSQAKLASINKMTSPTVIPPLKIDIEK